MSLFFQRLKSQGIAAYYATGRRSSSPHPHPGMKRIRELREESRRKPEPRWSDTGEIGGKRSDDTSLSESEPEENAVGDKGSGDKDEKQGPPDELDENDAILYMAKKVDKKEDEKVLFRPTFTINGGRLTVLERVGCGAFGNVYKVRDTESGKTRALKILIPRESDTENKEGNAWMNREIAALTYIYHQNPDIVAKRIIVKMFSVFELNKHTCILYEYLGPNLHDVIYSDTFKGFSWKEIQRISYQICVALNCLHSMNMIHHDVKPDNIVFAYPHYDIHSGMEPHIKLIDFGSAVSATYTGGTIGTTARYRSPEISIRGYAGFHNDIWSLGCTMFEMYTGHPLFKIRNDVEKCYLVEAILCESIPTTLSKKSDMKCFDENGKLVYTEEWKQFINVFAKPFDEYNTTPKSKTAVHFFDLLKKMLIVRHHFRIDSCEALRHPFFKGDFYCERYEPQPLPLNAGPSGAGKGPCAT